MAVCDRVTVLRDGQTVGKVATAECSERDLAQMMVGRQVSHSLPKAPLQVGHPRLILQNLWVENDRKLPALQGIDLTVREGEIVGIAGVDGNGQQELEEAITGLRQPQQGKVQQEGSLAHIPSDRYAMGLLGDFSVAENLVLRQINQPPLRLKDCCAPLLSCAMLPSWLNTSASARLR